MRHGASRGRSSRWWSAAVARERPLEPRPGEEHAERQRGERRRRRRTGWDERVAEGVAAPSSGISRSAPISQPRYQSGCAPLVASAGSIRAPLPDRVDLDEPAEQHEHGGDAEQQRERAQGVRRPQRRADDVALGAARPAELGVPEHTTTRGGSRSARRSAPGQRARARCTAGDSNAFAAGERAAPEQVARAAPPTSGIDSDDRVGDRQAHARRAGRRAASSRRTPRARPGISMARPMQQFSSRGRRNAPGEEDPQQVQDDRREEHAAPPSGGSGASAARPGTSKREIDGRAVGLGTSRPRQRRVRALVDDLVAAGVEEEASGRRRSRPARRSSRARSRPSRNDQWSGNT